jgi:tetratricopeptide (TPR) repeat protein
MKKGNLDVALDYYHQQLKMEEQCLPFDHSDLSNHLSWIIVTYKTMGEIDKALEFCQEKLHVQKNRLGDNHPRVARTLMIIADLIKHNDANEALQYYKDALTILENSIPPDYQVISDCLKNVACLYDEYDMMEYALRCYLKALELDRLTLSSDHTSIANSLRNIGLFYEKMNNLTEALRYFIESLSICRTNYGPENKYVKLLEADIARLTDKQLSPSPREEEQKSMQDESRPVSDPSASHQSSPSSDFTTKSPSNHANKSKHASNTKSKTCLIL